MKQKAKRLCGATSEKVDASTFTPAEPLNADVKTGARPISRRAFKVGGKVHGAEAMTHAGRTPRKSGGKTEYANALVNRNVKDANEEREGIKHVGGFAKGGAPEYNEESVDKAIQSSRQKIGKKESSAIKSLLQGRKASMPMKKDDDGKSEYAKGGRTAKQVGGDLTSSMRPMPRPTPEMMDEMGIARPTTMATSPRPKPRPSPERMREIMDAAAEAEGMRALERANKAAERDQYDLETLGRKRGGKAEKFEGSAKDEMQDKKLAAKRGMSMKEWEASKADDKHDKQESMKGLKSGGRTAKMGGGSMGYAAGGKMKMVEKDGKKVPAFAADGVGKMANGGGLYANIHAKRERGEKMRKPGAKGAPSASDFKDAAKTAKKDGGGMEMMSPAVMIAKNPKMMSPAAMLMGRKNGGKAMHHKDCMCKACGGAAMAQEGGRTARKSGGKVGKSNISINIFPHNAEKPGAMPVPPAGMPPMMKPPMPMPAPAPMPSAPPPAHMSIPPGLQQALAGAAGAGPMPPAGGGMPPPMMNRPPMPAPMMGRKAGGKVVYPITGGAGGGRARKEKVDAYGEKMNKDLRK